MEERKKQRIKRENKKKKRRKVKRDDNPEKSIIEYNFSNGYSRQENGSHDQNCDVNV